MRSDRRHEDDSGEETIDLHGLTAEQALRRIAQELHAARVRRLARVTVVTGAGWGSPDRKPVLLPRVEAWLRGPEARALGVRDVRRARGGGALDVRLG